LTDRARLVYALLRTLLAWTPAPRLRSGLDQIPRGFVRTKRFVSCPDCLANDRTLPGCETCRGRGEIPDDGADPYETKEFKRFGGIAQERADDQARQLDHELRRLEYQLHRPDRREDELVSDTLTNAVELRDRMYRQGSYRALEQALHRLRDVHPLAYQLAMTVAYHPLGEPPIDPLRPAAIVVCELLGVWIDGPIRVPDFVTVSTEQEVERLAREGKGALWRGRGDWHNLKRGERDALIVAMHSDGKSPTEIGLRFNVTRRRVQQIVADKLDAGVASGPAA